MQIAIVRPHEPPATPVDVCIVIDVLRATTTASVLCQRLGELCVVPTLAGLGQLPARDPGYVLFSELASDDATIPKLDNSPVAARDRDLGGRTPVLVTTNGTLAVSIASQCAREVVLGSFVNLTAIVDYVRARGIASVGVMPAGNIKKAGLCSEDDACAETLAARLAGRDLDPALLLAACRVDERILRRVSKEPGLPADIDLCFSVDAVPVVPRVAQQPAGYYAVRGAQ